MAQNGCFQNGGLRNWLIFSNLISRAIRVVKVWYIRFFGMLIPFMTIEMLSIDRKWLKMAVFKMAASEIDLFSQISFLELSKL